MLAGLIGCCFSSEDKCPNQKDVSLNQENSSEHTSDYNNSKPANKSSITSSDIKGADQEKLKKFNEGLKHEKTKQLLLTFEEKKHDEYFDNQSVSSNLKNELDTMKKNPDCLSKSKLNKAKSNVETINVSDILMLSGYQIWYLLQISDDHQGRGLIFS